MEIDGRRALVEACKALNARGLSQGTSGNVSIRVGNTMLISPSATPYDSMTPETVAAMDLSGEMTGNWEGPLKPSTEWRIHWLLLKSRPEISAIVHAHPPHCTALAILRKPIPACHYMVAAFGGSDVRCAGYDTFGTEKLARMAVTAMKERTACLLANHGMITAGESIEKAMWRAVELETLAQQYWLALQLGDPVVLDDSMIAETLAGFAGYGIKEN